jgi:hypothetical protein
MAYELSTSGSLPAANPAQLEQPVNFKNYGFTTMPRKAGEPASDVDIGDIEHALVADSTEAESGLDTPLWLTVNFLHRVVESVHGGLTR